MLRTLVKQNDRIISLFENQINKKLDKCSGSGRVAEDTNSLSPLFGDKQETDHCRIQRRLLFYGSVYNYIKLNIQISKYE